MYARIILKHEERVQDRTENVVFKVNVFPVCVNYGRKSTV